MFAMVDVAATGMDGEAYAFDLLAREGVALMPGTSFGETLRTWVRVALTVDDAAFDTAVARILRHAGGL
jgi:arginine:pyruvate transaminase